MVVDVNESRCEDEAFGVEGGFVFFGLQFADADDVTLRDADVGFAQGSPGAIREERIQDEKRSGLLLRAHGPESHGRERQGNNSGDNYHSSNHSHATLLSTVSLERTAIMTVQK